MKNLVTIALSATVLLAGCSSNEVNNSKIADDEAYCASFGEICPQNESRCEFCGVTQASSYASCHSKEFCQNTPI